MEAVGHLVLDFGRCRWLIAVLQARTKRYNRWSRDAKDVMKTGERKENHSFNLFVHDKVFCCYNSNNSGIKYDGGYSF